MMRNTAQISAQISAKHSRVDFGEPSPQETFERERRIGFVARASMSISWSPGLLHSAEAAFGNEGSIFVFQQFCPLLTALHLFQQR
jgi:hypothetical protein